MRGRSEPWRAEPPLQGFSLAAAGRSRYLVIGGYAVGFHARPRFTKDIDLWIGTDPANLERVVAGLVRFGAPPRIVDSLRTAGPDEIVWMGAPPVRVDVLRSVAGLDFEEAYRGRVDGEWDGVPVSVIGRDHLIAAKRAAGRPQDLLDLEELQRGRA